MDIRPKTPTATSSPHPPLVKTEAPTEAIPRLHPKGQGISPVEVPLVVSSSELSTELSAKGSSVTHIDIVDTPTETVGPAPPPEPTYKTVKPRAIQTEEMDKVLETYHATVKETLESAPDGSALNKFETALRLMSNLKDPRLKDDPQAFDTLTMRKSQVEAEYQKLVQDPEVKSAFESAQKKALESIFGENVAYRAHQQAAYLLSDSFQDELSTLPAEEIQGKVQQEISALSILNPRLAENITDQLLEKTLKAQSLRMLQSDTEAGLASRESLAEAMSLYLRAQQTAAGISLQATNLSRLATLSDDKITELSKAVADLAKGTQATDYNKLAQTLLDKVDELPAELQQDATSFISHMNTQNALGAVLLAGSVAGLLQRDLPEDPKSWASLTSASLGTASMSHFAFRLAGLNQAADIASKINFKASLSGLKVPVVGSVVIGINTTLDAIAMAEEYKNEDAVGMATRAMGVGTGLATLGAITLASGPAAPVILIGSTVVGLAAWGVDSMWGESDLTGRVRQDLRKLDISTQEEKTLEAYTTQPVTIEGFNGPGPASPHTVQVPISRLETQQKLASAPLEDRIKLVNGLMDQHTDGLEEDIIYDTLTQTDDQEYMALMASLNTGRLASEIEDDAQLMPLLYRAERLAKTPEQAAKVLEPALVRLTQDKRYDALQHYLSFTSDEQKAAFSAEALQDTFGHLLDDWHRGSDNKALIKRLMTDKVFQPKLQLKSKEQIKPWLKELSDDEVSHLLKPLLKNQDGIALLEELYSSPKKNNRRNQQLTHFGANNKAYQVTLALAKELNDQEIQALPTELRDRMKAMLERLNNATFFDNSELTQQISRF